ncbi:vWA domain-containing protein [Patulibacter americanus]|uniref:vWA domain-containing protein n=1 Tax=Patulibacter americanus TaxID=588672 RepID=UPI0003B698EB|nr:VWA domain-containing protein [Patulibacter americanus]
MHLSALLDVEVVAVEAEDELSVLLELQAPQSEAQAARPAHTLQVVLDRSGSMGGGRLEAAKRGLRELVGRLDPKDQFGLVTFDNEVRVDVPCGPLTDRDAVLRAIDRVHVRGSTNLSAGLIRGIEEARDAKGDGGATVLLLSDGHANNGATDPDVLRDLATGARRDGMTLSTIGIGLGYDEVLLSEIAAGGTGNAHFAEEADATAAALASEVDGLLDQVVQAATLTVKPSADVRSVTLYNDLPVSEVDGGFRVELGNFMSGEDRKLLLRVAIPAKADLGLARVCDLRLRWTDVATLKTQTVDVPVHVGVVPGDEAAGRIPNATVRTEFEYQRAQKSRKEASDALRRGDRDAASGLLAGSADALMDRRGRRSATSRSSTRSSASGCRGRPSRRARRSGSGRSAARAARGKTPPRGGGGRGADGRGRGASPGRTPRVPSPLCPRPAVLPSTARWWSRH